MNMLYSLIKKKLIKILNDDLSLNFKNISESNLPRCKLLNIS